MDTEKKQEQLDLEEEYMRIAENEEIHYDEINLWRKLDAISSVLFVVFFLPTFLFMIRMLDVAQNSEILTSPETIYLFYFGLCPFLIMVLTSQFASRKVSEINTELGLTKEERLFLSVYETYRNIDSYLEEPKMKRKAYFRKFALEKTQEIVKGVNVWNYGNIPLVRNLVGSQFDLLKNNMERLVLSNVAKGDETTLGEISKFLIEFCRYILSPSVEKLIELNNMMNKLPYTKYEVLGKKQRVKDYFSTRPRGSRLLFAFAVTTTLIVVMLCLSQNIAVTFAVAVPTFWGAFAGFDKLFRSKEK